MKIFINEIPVVIKQPSIGKDNTYKQEITGNDTIISEDLMGKVLLNNCKTDHVITLLKTLTLNKHDKIDSIDIESNDRDDLVKQLSNSFQIIEAAGGVVTKSNKILFILRNEKWDLPKGKLEIGESIEEAAVREVEEETGVISEITKDLTISWHTYKMNESYVLKKTYWYVMKCIDDSHIVPQSIEGIQLVKWLDKKQSEIAMMHSYKSIDDVLNQHHEGQSL